MSYKNHETAVWRKDYIFIYLFIVGHLLHATNENFENRVWQETSILQIVLLGGGGGGVGEGVKHIAGTFTLVEGLVSHSPNFLTNYL